MTETTLQNNKNFVKLCGTSEITCLNLSKMCAYRFVFGHQCHHHSIPLHCGPGGSEHHSVLRRVPATPKCRFTGGEMDLPTSGHRPAGGWTPNCPRQHEEGPFLWQLHQELPVAQTEADGGEAGEDLWPSHLECGGGGPGALHVPGAGV